MSNSIHTFHAATAEEAMAQIRRELGPDAVVIEVKQLSSGGMLGWLSSRRSFEVTASRSATEQRTIRSAANSSRPGLPSNIGTIAAAAAASKSEHSIPSIDAKAALKPVPFEAIQTSLEFQELPANPDRAIIPISDMVPLPPLFPELSGPRNRIAGIRDFPSSTVQATPGLTSRTDSWEQLAKDIARGMSTAEVRPPLAMNPSSQLIERLDALQQMIADLGRRSGMHGLVAIPPELFPHYLSLVEAGVEDNMAHEVIQKLQRHAAPGQMSDTASTTALMTALIEQMIPCGQSLLVPRSADDTTVARRRQIAMVVGPTGVGKTTTLAKLAGHFSIHERCRLGLITVDTYRVAAVEQLRTYAEIIDLPMHVVANAAEMQEALDAFADYDLVLIDTAGHSPQDDRRLNELKQLIDAACPDHVYLVLSLASGASSLRAAAERFSTVRPTSLVITKLDEATGCGGLLSVARDTGLPISYFTTGQEVPRDLEPANACRAARLIAGTDSINPSLQNKH